MTLTEGRMSGLERAEENHLFASQVIRVHHSIFSSIFNKLSTFSPSDLHVPAFTRSVLLSQKEDPPQRPEASEPAH